MSRYYLDWIGTVLALSGGFLLSMNYEVSIYAWIVTSIASFALVLWSTSIKALSQVVLHGVYLVINLNGVYQYLLV